MRSTRKAEEEFGAFYRGQWPVLVAALQWSVPRPEDARDAAQEAFVRAFERWRQVRNHPSPEGWVFATGFRIATGMRRRARTLESKLPLVAVADTREPGSDVELKELLVLLTPRERAALLLRHYYGLSTRETAEVLHCREGTVKSLLHRGVGRIQPRAPGRSTA